MNVGIIKRVVFEYEHNASASHILRRFFSAIHQER